MVERRTEPNHYWFFLVKSRFLWIPFYILPAIGLESTNSGYELFVSLWWWKLRIGLHRYPYLFWWCKERKFFWWR